jgi:hypothetical protein
MDESGRYFSSSSTDFAPGLQRKRRNPVKIQHKMLRVTCVLTVVLMLQASRACGGNNEEEQLAAARQQSDEYFANAFGYTSNPWDSAYYQPSAPGK